jgi:hypothetical protein
MRAFFISREASAVEWGYEKEGWKGKLHVYEVQSVTRTCLPLPLSPSPPRCDKGSSWLACPTSSLPRTPPPPYHLGQTFWNLARSRGWPLIWRLWVWQLILDSNSDQIRIFGSVIGHLGAEIGFWSFHRNWWKYARLPIILTSAYILACQACTSSWYSTGETPLIKAGRLGLWQRGSISTSIWTRALQPVQEEVSNWWFRRAQTVSGPPTFSRSADISPGAEILTPDKILSSAYISARRQYFGGRHYFVHLPIFWRAPIFWESANIFMRRQYFGNPPIFHETPIF